MCSRFFIMLAGLCLAVPSAWAQFDEGYVIITSEQTRSGPQNCRKPCTDNDDCLAEELGRCVSVPNVGSVCMPLREESEPPQDRSLCSNPYVQCDATYTCVQLPGPQLTDAFVAHKSARGVTFH